MKLHSFLSIILFVVVFQRVTYPQQTIPPKPISDTAQTSLLKTDADFNKLAAQKGFIDAFLAYMADDAILFPAGSGPITGRENIRKHLSDGPADAILSWQPQKAYVAISGDLGCTYGTSEYKFKGQDGKPVIHYGKYITVWKKQPDKSWKFILDIGNQSPPPEKK